MEFPQIPAEELERRRQAHLVPRPTLYRGTPPIPESWRPPEIKLAGPRERIEEVDASIVQVIQGFAWRLECGVQDDTTFALGLQNNWYGASQALVEPFGGEIIPNVTDPNHWWAKPAVASPAEALKLREPRELGPHLTRALELLAYIRDSVEGAYPVGGLVITSPFDTASYILGFQPLMEAVYEHPRAVHHVCELVTEFLLRFLPLALRAANPSLSDADIAAAGAGLCSETRAVISDQILAEFETPYLQHIKKAFGSLGIHSCGNWVHHMPRLAREGYADSVDFGHPECDFREVVKIVNGAVSIYPTTNVSNSTFQMPPEEWYYQVLGATQDSTRLVLDVPHEQVEAFNLTWERLEKEGRLALPLRNLGPLPPIQV